MYRHRHIEFKLTFHSKSIYQLAISSTPSLNVFAPKKKFRISLTIFGNWEGVVNTEFIQQIQRKSEASGT